MAQKKAPNKKAPAKTAKKKPALDTETKVEVVFPDNLPVSYSNHVTMTVSDIDVTLDLGLRDINHKKILINQRVMMSIQHAKIFVDKLNSLIKAYEDDFGKIKIEQKKNK